MERFEEITVCAECGEDLTSVSWDKANGNGWDGVTTCSSCRVIEGDTDTVFECTNCGERYSTEDCKCWSPENVIKLNSELEAWKRYAEDLDNWWLKYKDDLDTMAAGMSRPSKPGYYRANND